MATTQNHKIPGTLKKAIDYATGDKVEEKLRDNIRESVAYVIDDKTGKVIYPTIHSTLNCGKGHPVNSFNYLIEKYGKSELKNGNARTKDGVPVLAWHYHQNFEGHVDPTIANEIGRRLAEEIFPDFPVVIGTHTNTENTHNHIIVCAWALDGHKWHQHNAAYRHVREVSDRLCEEYGLSVLRDTKKQRLIRWKDEEGKIHYYEPTGRKNEMLRQREAGEIFEDDVGSYRNSLSYKRSIKREATNREIIKRDIDNLLPVANSYEHLLEMLRNLGYTIKDKKKNGGWLEHITFQPPTADKGTRDYKLENTGFYIRTNLEQVIADFCADRAAAELERGAQQGAQETKLQEEEKPKAAEKKIPTYFSSYRYGETNLSAIDEDVRTVRGKDGTYKTVPRGETEKVVISNIRIMDGELRLLDTSELERLVMEQHEGKETLIRQIDEGFLALRFMERESLYTQAQINSVRQTTRAQYSECMRMVDKAESLITHLEQVLKAPDKAEIIEARIARMRGNRDYEEHGLARDREQLQVCRDTMQKYKLTSPENIASLFAQVEQYKGKMEQLQETLAKQRERLAELDRCVSVLSRIERENGRDKEKFTQGSETIHKKSMEKSGQMAKKGNKKKNMER